MEKSKINNKRKQASPDFNGNSKSTKLESNNNNNSKDKNGNKIKIRDEVISSDGRVYYLCRYCNKVFQIKKERTNHLRKCPAKSYILSVADSYDNKDGNEQVQEEGEKEALITNNNNNNNDSKKLDAFDRLLASKTNETYLNNDKINIKQNIVLKKSKSPIKLTIRRSPSKDGNNETYFTVTENEQTIPPDTDQDNSNNKTTEIINEEKSDNTSDTASKPTNIIDNNDKKVCRQCKLTFNNGIDLLRHVRELHKYPKIVMAMSEIKKYYQLKDWTKCPICTKPLTKNYRSAYLRHLNTHANELEFSCNICGRKFRRSDHMKEHAKRHIIENQTNDD